MSPLTLTSIATLLIAATLPIAARAAADDVRGDAWLNQSVRQYRESRSDQVAWHNPHMPQASVSYMAPAAAGEDAATALVDSDRSESADQRMARIVAQYGRAMLDRGGWDNPYLPSVALGNPIAAVALGAGVTVGQQPTRSVTSAPKNGDETEEEGAGSGEPQTSPPKDTHPRAK